MERRRTVLRGVTLAECLIVIVVLVVLLAIGAIVPLELARRARESQDQHQLQQIHSSMQAFARSNDGRLPLPGLIDRLCLSQCLYPCVFGDIDHSKNHTAFLYSAMIAQKFITPELLISPCEVNGRVREKDNYDNTAYQPANGLFWDRSFVADITNDFSGSNASYAHLVLCGDRMAIQWRDRANAAMPMLGTRGTRQGAASGAEFFRSPTLKLAGSPARWEGFIVFGDNHVETLKSFTSPAVRYDPFGRGALTVDNMYACEFNDGPAGDLNQSAGDAWLSITLPQHAEFRCSPIWDPLD